MPSVCQVYLQLGLSSWTCWLPDVTLKAWLKKFRLSLKHWINDIIKMNRTSRTMVIDKRVVHFGKLTDKFY